MADKAKHEFTYKLEPIRNLMEAYGLSLDNIPKNTYRRMMMEIEFAVDKMGKMMGHEKDYGEMDARDIHSTLQYLDADKVIAVIKEKYKV